MSFQGEYHAQAPVMYYRDPTTGAFYPVDQPAPDGTYVVRKRAAQATSARRIVMHCVAFMVCAALAAPAGTAVAEALNSMWTEDASGGFGGFTVGTVVLSLVIYLGGVWWPLDARMLRRGTNPGLRGLYSFFAWLVTVSLAGTGVIVIILLTLVFGNPDALAWTGAFFASLVIVTMAGIPALLLGGVASGRPAVIAPQVA